jgi:hypothetical protein
VSLPARRAVERLCRRDGDRLSRRKALDPDGDSLVDKRTMFVEDNHLGPPNSECSGGIRSDAHWRIIRRDI